MHDKSAFVRETSCCATLQMAQKPSLKYLSFTAASKGDLRKEAVQWMVCWLVQT